MAKKSKSKKSKGKKAAKSDARQAEAAASGEVLGRTIDEVYNYLDAINKQTSGELKETQKQFEPTSLIWGVAWRTKSIS